MTWSKNQSFPRHTTVTMLTTESKTSPHEVPQNKPAKSPGTVAAGNNNNNEWNQGIEKPKRELQGLRIAVPTAVPTAATTLAVPVAGTAAEVNPGTTTNQSMPGFYLLSITGFIVSLLGLYYKWHKAMALVRRRTSSALAGTVSRKKLTWQHSKFQSKVNESFIHIRKFPGQNSLKKEFKQGLYFQPRFHVGYFMTCAVLRAN